MEERLARLEQALAELQQENRELRAEVEALRAIVLEDHGFDVPDASSGDEPAAHDAAFERARRGAIAADEPVPGAAPSAADVVRRSRVRGRYSVAFLILGLILVPVALITIGHLNAFWSTVVASLNAVIFYFVGPSAYHLLVEGLIRAIPGILLGQTARVTVDKMRNRRSRQP